MIALLFLTPLVAGAVVVILGMYDKHQGLMAAGEMLLIIVCILAALQAYMA